MDKFKPDSPDNNLKKPVDMTLARFGHLNKVVEEVNAATAMASATAAVLAAAATNVYADNADALLGGLSVGTMYSTATGEVRIVV